MSKDEQKMIGVPLPFSLITHIQKEAKEADRSLSAQIRFILKQRYNEKEGESDADEN